MEKLTRISDHLKLPRQSSEPESAYDCEPCSDSGWVTVFVETGRNLGVKRCACLTRQIRQRALARIPPTYRDLDLMTIEPRLDLHEKQGLLIEHLRAEPECSYALLGRNGCGKSMVGWLLYKRAVEQGRPAIGLPTAELLAQFRRWETGGNMPAIDAETLRDDRRRWLIFLDEFDKARPTEFASEVLFAVLDAAYSYMHQVVITSNLRQSELKDHWARFSEVYGPSIMRRVLELPDITEVELF
jgi:DNA replication protein DnaC